MWYSKKNLRSAENTRGEVQKTQESRNRPTGDYTWRGCSKTYKNAQNKAVQTCEANINGIYDKESNGIETRDNNQTEAKTKTKMGRPNPGVYEEDERDGCKQRKLEGDREAKMYINL